MNVQPPADNFMVAPGMRARRSSIDNPVPRRLPGTGWLPIAAKNHVIGMLGEFVGTFLFLFFAFAATQVANMAAADNPLGNAGPDVIVLLYVSLAFGFSLAVTAWVFFRISGGLFNPAVTLGLALIGAIGWIRALLVVIAQILGAIAAAGIVSALFPGPLLVRTTLSSNPITTIQQGLFIEMFLTALLVFTIFMLAAEKHKGTFIAPVGIGLALYIAILAGGYFTGGSLNPARSFGPDVILGTFESYHWIYWVGPALGAVVAVLFYRLIKTLEYETANPGQDYDQEQSQASRFKSDEDPEAAVGGRNAGRASAY